MKISLIIPIYNEASTIFKLLNYLETNTTRYIEEIIVVDANSTDNAPEKLATYKGIRFFNSQKGRAKQMNFGAKKAKATILYFLHADSFPPKNFDLYIINQVKSKVPAGCFRLKFASEHWWLRLMGWFTRVNCLACRGGDQSLFVQKTLFESLGGFDSSYSVYEDVEFVKRLYKTAKFGVIPKNITTSARLYEKIGVWKLQLIFIEIYIKRFFGASAEALKAHYHKRVSLALNKAALTN